MTTNNDASPFDGIDLTASPPRDERSVAVPAASPRKLPPKKGAPIKQGTIFAFFPEKRSRGRPKKGSEPKPKTVTLYASKKEEKKAKAAAKKAAKAAAAAEAVADVDTSEDAPVAPAAAKQGGKKKAQANAPGQPKPKQRRKNYSKGEDYERLKKAVYDWDNNTGDKEDDNGELLNMDAFCIVVGISRNTFEKYVHADPAKRRKLGRSAGRPTLMSEESKGIIEDALARADRANDGYSRKEAVDIIQELHPDMSRKTASRQLSRRVLPKSTKLKKNVVKAQKTTTKRTAITISQQYRWHTLIDSVYQILREKNAGKCRKSGKSFGEVMHHFIVGGDETCVMANHAGDVKIIGSADVKKHEKNVDDSRCSMTMYRTGTASGNQGPTMFLLAGEKRRMGYGPAFLKKYGAATGSDIYMNESAYMTTETWEEMAEPLMQGYRELPYLKENPQWHFVEVTDGFGAHHNSYKALKIRSDDKCISVKEEGDTSQCNQAYDAFVGLEDKRSNVDSLSMMRRQRYRGDGVIDQWGLVHVGLHAVRGTKAETWEASFIRVNLHPHFRLPFAEWCKKMSTALLAGQTFKEETAVNTYNLLPSCWQGMDPEEKKRATKVIDDCGGLTVDAVRRLQTEANVLLSDMQSIRLAYEVAKQHPEQLDMVAPSSDDVERIEASSELAAKAQMRSATHGLASFELKPEGMSNDDLFPHMIKVRKRTANAPSKPSEYLNVEMTADQQSILEPTQFDLAASRILENAGGRGAKMKVAERRLNAAGEVQNFSSLTNSDERLRRLENAKTLECSLAEISRLDQAEKEKKAEEEKEEYELKLPKAVRKYLSAGRQVDDLTCKEIRAIALCVYSEEMSKSKRKGEHVSALKRLIANNPSKVSAAEARASESVQGDSDENNEDDEDDEDDEEEAAGTCTVEPVHVDGDAYKGKRIAALRKGAIRLGTVVDFGEDEETGDNAWDIEFDGDEDVVDYTDGTKGKKENFSYAELKDSLQLYDEEGFMLED